MLIPVKSLCEIYYKTVFLNLWSKLNKNIFGRSLIITIPAFGDTLLYAWAGKYETKNGLLTFSQTAIEN